MKVMLNEWKKAYGLGKPVTIFAHCNEGTNRAPVAASLLASKFQSCQPIELSKILAQYRDINPMFSGGEMEAYGPSKITWENMNSVIDKWPHAVSWEGREMRYSPVDQKTPVLGVRPRRKGPIDFSKPSMGGTTGRR